MISASSLKSNLKKYNITVYPVQLLDNVNKMFNKFFTLKMNKYVKKGGGDYFLPSEYYGTDSGRYTDGVENFPSTLADDLYIKPALDVNILDGGAGKFTVSKSAVDAICKQLNVSNIKLTKTIKTAWTREFQALIDEILKSVVKKNGDFSKVLKLKKYSKYL